jgi:hypothetical protein
MSEEEIENAFRELRNELKTCKEQVVCLKEDRQILLKHRSIARHDIVDMAHQLGNRGLRPLGRSEVPCIFGKISHSSLKGPHRGSN